MNIKPIGERVLLKPIKKEEKTKSGILLSSKSSIPIASFFIFTSL